MRVDLKPERKNFRPVKTDFRTERADSCHERADSMPEMVYFRSERVDFRPERADFRPETAWEGRTNGQTYKQTDATKSPCVLQDFVPFGIAAQKALIYKKALVISSFRATAQKG